MLRRQFVHRAALSMLSGAASYIIPRLGRAATGSWQEAFAASLEKHPWLLAFRSAGSNSFGAVAETTGRIPEGLAGTLYRNGPARHEIGSFRYHHWFDGDGMIQAWRIRPEGVSHQARMIATRKYLAEQDAGRALYPGFATVPPDPRPVTSPDLVNTANISVLAHHGELFALWEAGSPWAIEPDTLATEGLHRFSADTSGLPFSAHPRVEADGTLWNFGYVSAAGKLVFWHIAPDGALVKTGLVDCDPMGMPHDFVVTERHLVVLIAPLHFEPDAGAATFLDAHRWHPERPTRVLVVDKNDFANHRYLELPAQWVFHFGNAWEDEAGIIRFDGARAPDPLAMIDSFRSIMRGEISPSSASVHHQYRIDLKRGTVTESPLLDAGIDSEFPVIDPRVSGRRYSTIVLLTRSGSAEHQMLNEVSRLNLDGGGLDTYRYPDGVIPEEHLYVAAPHSEPETRGWVVGSALNYRDARMELNIFAAERLGDGPVASARLPYALPMGLHGKFV
ncbi:MAG: carotenoid oxygenase family protein [Pseudomonadales bacterium]